MDTGIFIALLNPSIALVLAAACLLLWFHQKTRPYMAVLSAGYAATAIGFLLQYFELPIGFYPTKFVSNVFFATAGVLVSTAIVSRYRRPVPYVALFMLAGAGLAGLLWFMTAEPSLTWRIYSMNFALGGMSFVVAAEVYKARQKASLDRLLLVASVLTGLNFTVRTVILVALNGGYDSYDGLYTSPYWTSALLTHALLSMVIALTLIIGSVTDVLAALRMEAHTDPLSGLLNRRGFEERARALIVAAGRGSAPLSLVLADLDHFKSVNDAHGHGVGDAVIAAFSGLLRGTGSEVTIIGRTGGEEFAILVPACDVAVARLLAEGLRAALSEGQVEGVPIGVGRVTASFGVATLESGEGLEALFRRADAALYQAKRDGRNRVRQAASAAGIGNEVMLTGTASEQPTRPMERRSFR